MKLFIATSCMETVHQSQKLKQTKILVTWIQSQNKMAFNLFEKKMRWNQDGMSYSLKI